MLSLGSEGNRYKNIANIFSKALLSFEKDQHWLPAVDVLFTVFPRLLKRTRVKRSIAKKKYPLHGGLFNNQHYKALLKYS